jgi:serine/threonine-protein kinase RsbT
MTSERQGELRIASETDIVVARKAVRIAATALGFGITDVTRIVTTASELTRNIYQYAGSGLMRWRDLVQGSNIGLELVFEDTGPGIPDVARALEKGFTTGKGLGLGLPGAKRLMDEMRITSQVGQGTTVEVRKWLRK